jgi:hypothetical protein
MPRMHTGLVSILMLAALCGCVSTTVKRLNAIPAEHAEREISGAQLLNVDIAVFDPGIPADPQARKEENIFLQVRRAEARYLPVNLRQTLQDTGHWGAVRVVPEPVNSAELMLTGEIVQSDGGLLELAVKARDASGRVWLDKVYDNQAGEYSYRAEQSDPFQGLYNRIANDLLAARRKLPVAELRDLVRLSKIRFAADLAPDSFDSYLAKDDGRYRLVGLPAVADPMTARIERIRQRDYAVIDALDQHYRVFHQQMRPAYNAWRATSYREAENLRELRRESLAHKLLGAAAVVGGIFGLVEANTGAGALAANAGIFGGAYLFKSGLDKAKESEIHAQALEELGQSLETDVKPRVVELEGQTVTLSGSAEAQYEEWRRLLKNIYAAETGFVSSETRRSQGAGVR